MKWFLCLLSLLIFIAQPLQAEGEPLRVAVDPINPPFIMQGANNQFYGYDISMMEYICHTIERTCQFIPIRFNQILNAVNSKKVDVAASSIGITTERAKLVNFSLPYLVSYARFIGPKAYAQQHFSLGLFNDKKIGVTEGSVFPEFIKKIGVKKPITVPYTNLNDMVDALYRGKINFGFMDEPSALYWQTQSSGKLVVLGKSFSYGLGLGIAVNKENLILLQAINNALLKYRESDDFKKNYHAYIEHVHM
ncbi:transporter substrate-binding domain-containing protein [Legionella fallonii]|uniref:Bacterial extracellular solute-binding protein n=1 Tax=Legionella fallonii LLAP-10 TaxID=1212491 RepID=A0A098FZR1_9GAMM|nr:transporter substrate-binding domain-containing protein [Legionella fallonii]CEG55722.1 Bacterial extracellular solute-binding protein [Legionella fallonii LLAP-10]